MRLSYVLITHNRRDALLNTLGRIAAHTDTPRDDYEVVVVDNNSSDGTAEALAERFPHVVLLRSGENLGMPARNIGLDAAGGDYIAILDDDSYPAPGSVDRAMSYMDAHETVGAVTGRVDLPDGRREASAMPGVLIGCASIIRKAVIDAIGGFAPEFFRQAEEYDFSFRLAAAGWTVERFEDLVFHHDKNPGGRSSALTARMDLRNNLILVERFIPETWRRTYREDWSQRYWAIAKQNGHPNAGRRAKFEAAAWAVREAATGRQTLDDDVFERLFGIDRMSRRIIEWAQQTGVGRVVVADLAKNMYPVYRGCMHAGLEIAAIADDAPAFNGLDYRGARVVDTDTALATSPEGILVANTNPARVAERADALRSRFDGPVLTLWEPSFIADVETVAPRAGAA